MKSFKKLRRALTMMLTLTVFATMMTIVAPQQASAAVDFNATPVPTLSNSTRKAAWSKIGKTMHLLKSGQKVRIAITGQSISDTWGNVWCKNLIDWLQAEYPNADIDYRNFGIGGFATGCLKKRMYNDMASFGPDLVIVYVYGSHIDYGNMIKDLRDNMETEILMQTEHYTGEDNWSDTMSYQHLPQIASDNDCGLAEIRFAWRKWIMDNFDGDASVLLKDNVHLNDDGQKFMLELMKQFFVVGDESDAAEKIAAQTVEVKASDWNNGVLEVSGVGTRAEVIAGDGTQHAVNVLVDGKKPSEYPDCYIRSAETGGMTGTIMGIINYNGVPGEQTWTINIDSYTDKENFKYTVTGSTSGSQGQSTAQGVLNGTILNMTPDSFIFDFSQPSAGTKYTFKSILNGTDVYNGTTGYSENKQLLFNFKSNGTNEHTVKLTAQDASKIPDIKAIRFYNPALRVTTSGSTGGNTGDDKNDLSNATVVFSEDFEDGSSSFGIALDKDASNKFTVVDDPVDPTNKVFMGADTSWGTFIGEKMFDADPSKEYTVKFCAYGDVAKLAIWNIREMWEFYTLTGDQLIIDASTKQNGSPKEWTWFVAKVKGPAEYKMIIQAQSNQGIMGGTMYIDDIVVYEGDYVEAVKEEIAASLATPTPEATPVPTATPDSSASAPVGPSASVTPAPTDGSQGLNPVPVKKVKIKLKKKTYKVKKGKKVTLKITLKNAKKAKFSVDKKGKKVVKLMKKKAKSVVVKGKKKGTAKITAKAAGKKATCKVKVK